MKKYLIMFLFLFLSHSIYAQTLRFKAIFIYNFTKHISWSNEQRVGNFVIGVLGNSPIIQELESNLRNKSVGNQSIVIMKYSSIVDINRCHILYVPQNKSKNIAGITKKLKKSSTLVVTDKGGLISKGADINFVMRKNKINFEISEKHIKYKGLKVTSALLKLGIAIQ